MRTRKGRVYVGPDRKKWRVEVREPGGKRTVRVLATEEEAEAVAGVYRRRFAQAEQTMSAAIEEYCEDLREQGRRDSHIDSTWYRLRSMFPDLNLTVAELSEHKAQGLYDELRTRVKVDTHRNTLNQCRTFGKWMIKKGWLASNPWKEIEGVGKRRKGKKQLTIDESRKLVAKCLESSETSATATLCCLVLAMRAGEVAAITPRSIDDGGRILRIEKAKTEAGIRLLEVPEFLRPRLPSLAAENVTRDWVYRQVKRWCRLAGVTVIGPHALRGTHASLATSAGATSQLVAGALGHSSTAVTEAHYSKEEARDGAKQRAALTVLAGGRS